MNNSEISGKPTIRAFLYVILGDWFTRMSGPLSVPFVFLALFFGGRTLKILFAILALVCGGFSAYWAWRKKRLARIEVEKAFFELRSHLKTEQVVFLNDILFELEDDLKIALDPRTHSSFGHATYITPSDAAWRTYRSRVSLPEGLRQEIQGVHGLIGRWISIVDTGVNPNLGSRDLEITAQQVAAMLPGIIRHLRIFSQAEG